MLDTLPTDDTTLRCEALFDRVAATPIGKNPHALRVVLAECDALERSIRNPSAICRLRDMRHWLRLAYGDALHGYPADQLRRIVLDAISGLERAHHGALSAALPEHRGAGWRLPFLFVDADRLVRRPGLSRLPSPCVRRRLRPRWHLRSGSCCR